MTTPNTEQEQPTDTQLLRFGYAPGNYMMKCFDCSTRAMGVDKRAVRCRPCAVLAFGENKTNHCAEGI